MRFWQRQQTEGMHNQGFLGDESMNHMQNNNSEYLDLQAVNYHKAKLNSLTTSSSKAS